MITTVQLFSRCLSLRASGFMLMLVILLVVPLPASAQDDGNANDRDNTPATGLPTISGTAQVGETLTADTSGIADSDGLTNVSYSYQWIRHYTQNRLEIVEIADATDSTYTLRPTDMGRLGPAVVSVRVSFTDDAGNYESLTSEPFGPFQPAPAEECPGTGDGPTPVEVAVEAIPIVVESTAEEYFVLYVLLDPDPLLPGEIPISVTLGQEPTAMLTDRLSALPKERYRVEKYLIADPADVDGDCIDDVTELQDSGMNPVNPAPAVPFADGVVAIPDHETFEAMLRENSITFLVMGLGSDAPAVYFINNETHLGFISNLNLRANPLYWEGKVHGVMEYHPDVIAPDGHMGVYLYNFHPNRPNRFARVALMHEVLAASMPAVDNNLAYRPTWPIELEQYDLDQALYDDSRVNVMLEEDILSDVEFIPFNQEEGYGVLRVMSLEERPNPRDIVIYEALPNELSRVAGIITTVPQTRLSHVNLRAVQDGVPNAFIRDALDDDDIDDLIGSFVHYTVTEDGYSISAATRAEVDAHYSDSRPAHTQTPERDLTITEITDLDDIGFDDWNAFGVKAANVAVLRTLGFSEGTVPDGFAVPFYFYDEFMKHNEFYEDIEEMLADPDFQSDFDTQESELKKLRKKIKKGESPQWMIDALVAMHATFPEGQSLRYRSSTNNEDLPGFSGAGLYDSKTQKPDETEEDGIDKSLKQVFASMWNFRAFTEREFHRIDHLAAAIGVLVHPNFSDELANGVAVSSNPIVGGVEGYYVNTQLGEDLVTNPEALSVPEEMLLHEDGRHEIIATSNRVEAGELLMSDAQMDQLRRHLEVIHDKFEELYRIEAGERFAMEIEFKITSENVLSIKQARPWVFSHVEDNSQATGKPTISGTAQVDETLTAETSDISDADGLTNAVFSYQWIRSDSGTDTDIARETGSTYVLSEADQGKTFRVRVSFTDDAGNEETLTSEATEAVAPNPNSPATGLPAISGTAQVDETLEAETSDISDADGLINATFSYQWIRSDGPTDTDIQDAVGSTYTLGVEDEGKTVKVRVSFTDDAGNQESLTSAATDSVAPTPLVWSADMSVVDLGNGAIGAVRSDLFSNEGGSADLQAKWLWYYTPGRYLRLAFTEVVPGAEELTLQIGDVALTLQAGDSNFTWSDLAVDWEDGQVIPVRIVRTSATVGTRPNSPATGQPTIGGTAQEDETLTADVSRIADADGLANVSYSYQWIRNDGNNDSDILDATDTTYTLDADDVGKTIKVRVTFTDDADNEETLTSTETVVVQQGSNAWSASMTVGTRDGFTGYSYWGDPHLGSLSATEVEWDGKTHYVRFLFLKDGELRLGLNEEMFSTGFVLSVGDEEFGSAEAMVDHGGASYRFRWDDPGLGWSDGNEVSVNLVQSDQNTPALGAPTISGTVQVDETLTADTSGVEDADGLDNVSYSYQWIRNDGNNDTNIVDATDVAYTLTDDDFGRTIKVRVTFTDDRGNAETLTSEATGAVAAAPNRDATGTPTITGTPQVGQTLTADTSPIADRDGLTNVSYSYQWIAGGSDIDGATGSSYELTSSEQGQTIKVRVTFTDDRDNAETLTSETTRAVAAAPNRDATGGPTITGTPQVGQTLTADTSPIADQDGLTNVSYSYQWIAGGSDIDGATGSSYELTSSEQGQTIQVRVTFTDDRDNEETLTSAATVAVAAKPNTAATGLPAISGTSQVGETLTASTSAIADGDGLNNVSYRYQWISGGTDIDGATGSSYELTSSEQGQTIQVRVTFTDDRGNAETLTSAATVAVAAAPNREATGQPTISGTPQVGQTLTADTSNISDLDGITNATFVYQWRRGGLTIIGANRSTYTLTASDQGKTITVRVRFTDDRNSIESRTSNATTAVAAAPNREATGQPTISGTPQVGQTLTADTANIADQDGLTGVSYRYQWIAGGTDIDGATGSSYELTSSEQGQTIQVKVTFTDDRNNAEMRTSDATMAVAAALSPLTVRVTTAAPATHDGSAAEFTFEIEFSEEFNLSYKTLKFDAFIVTGGEVLKAQRTDKPSNIPWRITVRPDSNEDVTIILPVTENCTADGAICTEDGRKLSNRLELTVSGPTA